MLSHRASPGGCDSVTAEPCLEGSAESSLVWWWEDSRALREQLRKADPEKGDFPQGGKEQLLSPEDALRAMMDQKHRVLLTARMQSPGPA